MLPVVEGLEEGRVLGIGDAKMAGGGPLVVDEAADRAPMVPPVPALMTIQAGIGWSSRLICSKIDSAMLLLPRQSVARSA